MVPICDRAPEPLPNFSFILHSSDLGARSLEKVFRPYQLNCTRRRSRASPGKPGLMVRAAHPAKPQTLL